MKIFFCLSLVCVCLFLSARANDSTNHAISIKPIGFRPTNNMIEGGWGQETALLYKDPCPNIQAPTSAFLKKMNINWNEHLRAGISSLLFEHKNYPTIQSLSSYTIFANGNYTTIDQSALDIANKFIFKNKTILNALYSWASPYYKETFSLLTVEEQQQLLSQLEIAAHYIDLVQVRHNEEAFKDWLQTSKMLPDEKVIGFLKRRLQKKQWSPKDCQYWISRIKADITPLLKDPTKAASHYQTIEKIDESTYIVMDHAGIFTITNAAFNPLIDGKYALIKIEDDHIIAYRSKELNDFRIYDLTSYKKNNTFKKFPFPEWNDFEEINDTTIRFFTANYQGIYNPKKQKLLLDSCIGIHIYRNEGVFIANRIISVLADTSDGKVYYDLDGVRTYIIHKATGYLLYQMNGEQISAITIKPNQEVSYSMTGQQITNETLPFKSILQKKWFVYRNENDQYGMINKAGKILLPFVYADIDISLFPAKIICTKMNGEREIFSSIPE